MVLGSQGREISQVAELAVDVNKMMVEFLRLFIQGLFLFNEWFFFIKDQEDVDHQNYLQNIERPKTSALRRVNNASQFDDDVADMLPD